MIPGETLLSGAAVELGVSELKVMRSAAGWYVGTTYTDPEDGFTEPNSRETDYFSSRAEAEKALESFAKTGVMEKERA